MLDTDLSSRTSIYRYLIKDDLVERIQPIAKSPRDFVDECLIINDLEANELSVKEKANDLLTMHADLKNRNGCYGDEVKFCKDEAFYKVIMTFNSTQTNEQNELYYFYITPVKKGYLMSIIDTKPKSCIN